MEVWIVFGALFILLAAGVPVFASLIASATLGIYLSDGWAVTLNTIGSTPFRSVSVEALIVIPLFILMGTFAYHSGATGDLFQVAKRGTRRLPGGLGMATVLTGGGLASVTGSSLAASALMARVSLAELVREGYGKRLSSGLVASVGTLGVLIPPSILLVIYGIAAQESIRLLLLAGLLPGLFSIVVYLCTIFVVQKSRDRTRARVGDAAFNGATNKDFDISEFTDEVAGPPASSWQQFVSVSLIGLTFLVVVGGLYAGFFTSVEAGAVGTLVAFLIVLAKARRGGVTIFTKVGRAISETVDVTGVIFIIVIGAGLFGYYLNSAGVPSSIVRFVTGIEGVNAAVIVLLLLLLLLPLGMFLEGLTIILIAVPLMHPAITSLGYDGIWLGVVMVKFIEIGLITPPVGLNAYVVSSTSGKRVSPEDVFLGVRPFLVADIITTMGLFFFPAIVLWLPNRIA